MSDIDRFNAWLSDRREANPLQSPTLFEAWSASMPSVASDLVVWTTLIEINCVKRNAGRAGSFYAAKAGPNDIPLFTHPPRAPLMDVEIVSIMESCLNDWDWKEFARAVESAVRQEQPHG